MPDPILSDPPLRSRRVGVIGAGPAGLMAAEVLSSSGIEVDVYDAMPSVGRKFLLAGRGGLNLTHGEAPDRFVQRYAEGGGKVAGWLATFGPAEVRAWAEGLGVRTFVGSSGRIFPLDMKAAPLLRAWLHRLRAAGVRFHTRHRWIGWDDASQRWSTSHAPRSGSDATVTSRSLRFVGRTGEVSVEAPAWILALGGASWPRLGSDGAWVTLLAHKGIEIAPLRASNCGFDVARPAGFTVGSIASADAAQGRSVPGWSDHFRSRFAGLPLKNVALAVGDPSNPVFHRRGELVITETGIEGSLVYAASSAIARALAGGRDAVVRLDLLPDRDVGFVRGEVARGRGSRSLSTHLKSRLGIDGVKAALLHELLPRETFADPAALGAAIKALPLVLVAARPIAEAISSAGGVTFEALTDDLMLRGLPGVFCCGEMLDWDAPTGGYLLTACFASGAVAARGALRWLSSGRDEST